MKQVMMVAVLAVVTGVLVQWGHAMVGVVVGIAATIMLFHQRNQVDIEEFYKGKSVILTGASKGIGKSIAIQLAQLGAKLVIAARSEDKLAETQHLCQEHTSHVHTVVADVSREEDCKTIVEKAVEEFGGVDILILNAAYSVTGQWFTEYKKPTTLERGGFDNFQLLPRVDSLLSGGGEFFSNVFGVNLLQSVYLVQHALPYLTTSKGTIVPVSSGSAIVSMPKFSAYSTSKHALHGFFKCLQQELIFTNTPVSITIMPLPYVLTNKAVEGFKPIGTGGGITPEDCAAKMIRGIPLGRTWYYIDWTTFIISHLYSLCPSFFDFFVRFHLRRHSHLFSQI